MNPQDMSTMKRKKAKDTHKLTKTCEIKWFLSSTSCAKANGTRAVMADARVLRDSVPPSGPCFTSISFYTRFVELRTLLRALSTNPDMELLIPKLEEVQKWDLTAVCSEIQQLGERLSPGETSTTALVSALEQDL